jgi:hypothetical protein
LANRRKQKCRVNLLRLISALISAGAPFLFSSAVPALADEAIDRPPSLQGYAKHDARGTPVVPEWKMEAGYDALLGKFYMSVVGLKVMPINGPPPAAVLGKSQLKHWRGHKPFPCVLKFTKLQDQSGGYYFQTVGSADGPRGWIIPQPSVPHRVKDWAIYFMQERDAALTPDTTENTDEHAAPPAQPSASQ